MQAVSPDDFGNAGLPFASAREIEIGMGLAPFREIIPEENRDAYRRAFQNWLADSELTGFDSDPLEGI